MALIKGMHHVSLKCCSKEEYEKEIAFYKDLLGLPVNRQWEKGIWFEAGSGILEIFNYGEPPQLEQGVIRHFCFETEDLNACLETLTKAGVEIYNGPKDSSIPTEPQFFARIAFCQGPMGEEIELLQEVKK